MNKPPFYAFFMRFIAHLACMYAAKPFTYGRPAVSERTPAKPARPQRYERRPLPPLAEVQLESLRVDQLREALRMNSISFPSQVPVFDRDDRPDLQRNFAQLYFVLGWSCGKIALRYGFVRQRVGQILNAWTRRAVEMGYIQIIPPPESLALLAAMLRDRLPEPASHSLPPLPAASLEHTL
jgi:hypothetical protein